MKVKENDVFDFRYKPEVEDKINESWGGSSRHCFDGQLIAKKDYKNHWSFVDTYWSFGNGGDDSHSFSLKEIREQGKITFVCNLADIEEIQEYEQKYYDDKDIFNLSHQHGCYKFYAIKKGTKKSNTKMLKTVNDKIQEAKRDLERAGDKIEEYSQKKTKIEAGDLTVYL